MTTPKPGDDHTSGNGWDLVDDYQLGKDVHSGEEEKSRRITRDPSQAATEANRPESVPTTRTLAKSPFWRMDGSADQDAETMARILAGRRERDDDAGSAITRARSQTELDHQDQIRQRQIQEISDHLALEESRRRPSVETPLQRALREAADMFLALGICPDHLEYLPEVDRFCSWGGQIYEHSQVFAMRDPRGLPVYVFGAGPHGPSTVCFSPRERRWGLREAVSPSEHLTPIDRLLPVPRRRADRSLRWSAQRPGAVLMEEGEVTVYIVRNAIYTASHLIAAHHLHSGVSSIDKLIQSAESVRGRVDTLTSGTASALDATASTVGERVISSIGSATDALTSAISSTTRFFRRKS